MAASPSSDSFYQLSTLDALLAEVGVTPQAETTPIAKPSDDPLDILVSLAQAGKIDPWNIDLVAVTEEYMRALTHQQAERRHGITENHQSNNLKVTGKSLLYLAILLRMKSDQLAGQDYLDAVLNQPGPEDDWLEDGDLGWGESDQLQVDPDWLRQMVPYQSLEAMIERRSSTKARRIRPVTLQDLIAELKKAEALEQEERYKRQVATVDRVRDVSRLTPKQIENLAHEEFIEENIVTLQRLLKDLLTNPKSEVTLSQLVVQGGLDKVSAYLALLFLSARNELDLSQTEMYGEVAVTPPNLSPQPVE